jgi:hypothetical protein
VGLLLEGHLPPKDAPPAPYAGALAAALRESGRQAARAVRDRGAPQWEPVREVLDGWPQGTEEDRIVRRGAELLLNTLDELAEALRPRSLGHRHPAGGPAPGRG